jgi:molybdenum cofactor cytidylyltransferase
MGGRDKLLEPVDGAPQLARIAAAAVASRADLLVAVLRPDDGGRRASLTDFGAQIVENPAAAQGMASSIRAGLAALPEDVDAVALLLADMPDLQAAHIDRVIAAFDPEEGRSLIRAADADGAPGHPVLFGRRWFETLARLEGDAGARAVLSEHADDVTLVPTPGRGATTDLDTPEAWEAWRRTRSAV